VVGQLRRLRGLLPLGLLQGRGILTRKLARRSVLALRKLLVRCVGEVWRWEDAPDEERLLNLRRKWLRMQQNGLSARRRALAHVWIATVDVTLGSDVDVRSGVVELLTLMRLVRQMGNRKVWWRRLVVLRLETLDRMMMVRSRWLRSVDISEIERGVRHLCMNRRSRSF
jgi:hypothetical protein